MADFLNKPVGEMDTAELTRLIENTVARMVPAIPSSLLELADLDAPIIAPTGAGGDQVLTYDAAKATWLPSTITSGSASSDGNDPDGPNVTLVSGPGWLKATWDPVAGTSDTVYYQVFIDDSDPGTSAPLMVGNTPATQLVIAKLADGSPLESGTTYHVRVASYSILDPSNTGLSNDATGQPGDMDGNVTTITNLDAGNITTGFLAAARIDAGTITASKLEAVLELVSALIAGNPGAERVEVGLGTDGAGNLDGFIGIRAFLDDGVTKTFQVDAATGDVYIKGTVDFGTGSRLGADFIDIYEQQSSGFLTPTVVQSPHIQNAGGGSGSTTLTWSFPTTVGNYRYLFIAINDKDASAPTTPSITGYTIKKQYQQASSGWGTNAMSIFMYESNDTTSQSSTGAIAFGDTVYYAVIGVELAGGAQFDVGNNGNEGSSSTMDTGATGTLSQANEIVFGLFASEDQAHDTSSLTAGYSVVTQANATDSGNPVLRLTLVSKVVSATTTQTITMNTAASDFWVAGCLTVKAAAGVPDPATPGSDRFRLYAKDVGTGQTRPYAVDNLGRKHDLLDPAGTLKPYAGSSAPDGYLLAYGQSLLRSDYPSLFAAIGTTYGAADGTHFNVPDMRGRVPVGLDNMGGVDGGQLNVANTLGATGGSQLVLLDRANIPQMQLQTSTGAAVREWSAGTGGGTTNAVRVGGTDGLIRTDNTGGDATIPGNVTSHDNMMPYILINWIIKY